MQKAHLVDTPKLGDYGLVDVNITPGRSALATMYGWRFDHGFVYVGQGQIVEAWIPFARQRPLSQYPGAIFYSADPTDRQRYDIAKWATEQVGTRPYDLVQTPYFEAFKYWLGIDLSWAMQFNPAFNCTPLVAYAYRAAGIELTDKEYLGLVSPDDLDFDRP
jgi:uncharacterized protein YycO